ncbi:hypothetical protein Acr_12g0008670 [Actinidia rufa]|uniref:Uncharacterized protein n=1 Tax=Actinidia rufa TaxID=165716 RepID=A0A7J0FIQ6_9ERIC|nr:hypothetical protein Acr_12g0008670 [Actinidia rufa]
MVHVLHSHPNLSGYQPSSSNDFEDTESDQNSWGDDSSDESSGNENGSCHNLDDMDDPNDKDVEMENQQQDEETEVHSGVDSSTISHFFGPLNSLPRPPEMGPHVLDTPSTNHSPGLTLSGPTEFILYPPQTPPLKKSEKQLCSSASDRDGNPCSDQCYLRLKVVKDLPEGSAVNYLRRFGNRSSGEEGRTPGSPSAEETGDDSMHHEMGKRKVPKNTTELPENLTLVSDDIQGSFKKQKRAWSAVTGNDFILWIHVQVKKNGRWNPGNLITMKALCPPKLRVNLLQTNSATLLVFLDKGLRTVPDVEQKALATVQNGLISRNLLSGLKTCIELSSDMFDDKAGMPRGAVGMPSSFSEDEET